MPLITKTVL